MFDFLPLQIWQRSNALSVAVHAALASRVRPGPPGLVSQLSRACASVPANIAEGAGQDSPGQTARFLDIAIASASEAQNHLALAGATGLISTTAAQQFATEITEIRRMTLGFKKWVLRSR